MEKTTDFKIIDKVFDGMLIRSDRYLFQEFKEHMSCVDNISFIQPTCNELHILYKKVLIITISKQENGNITESLIGLYPGFFTHRNRSVFSTINRVLKYYYPKQFVKLLKMEWYLCEDNK